ncbi:DUF5994 family protein [Pseudonocardia kunmingensis]|uniref:Uncharacterized protein n=1 Tax=Pseudonocardia kunmingensis TaxID=630975 RepID=A0A543E261_9PSEU|nr:DUF5994 family protein [Pseudonocardia kunmingensis]TQM15676.1 hypothetical protein FB558_2466 [Pseudonocardia kunmingensis]
MTSAPSTIHTSQPAPVDHEQPRSTLKPSAPLTGRVDGGWWPRSRDLAAELPALQAVVAERLGIVESVSYHLGDWDPAARRAVVGGRSVRLAGYRAQHPATIDVLGARRRLTLLVVSPDTAPATAHAALAAAGSPGNTDEIEALLHAGAVADGNEQR